MSVASYCALSLKVLLLSWALILEGADSSLLSSNDWRQLWLKDPSAAWHGKSATELLKLAEKGHPVAQFLLWQKLPPSAKEKAQAMLDSSAKVGFPQALFERGFRIFSEYSSSREERLRGWAMMEKAAETGYPFAVMMVAQYDIGYVTSDRLVRPNLNRGLHYLRYTADVGYAESMMHLALLYSSGVGEPRGESDSPHHLLVAAAKKGHRDAMTHLSDRYAFGHGETVDPLEAARWRYLARQKPMDPFAKYEYVDAEANPKAQDLLALDEMARALSLFIKAGEGKNADAAAALARRYLESGKPGESATLLRFAKQLGNTEAAAELKNIEPTLSPEQKARSEDESVFPFAPNIQ